MTPNYDAAATAASEILIKHAICATPIDPMPILKSLPGVLVVSFAEMAFQLSHDRQSIITTMGENQDAVTSVKLVRDNLHYIVAYNQRLPFYMLQRAIARELAHIVLHHDGSRPNDVRQAEAMTFAHHLLCPRSVIKAIQDAGITITIEKLGCITGCYERCLISMRKIPACHVPSSLNLRLKAQFSDYIDNFVNFISILPKDDDSTVADFGTFMEGYEE